MNDGCCFPRARRCTATSKRTKERCRAPAVTGWTVCRFHGARGGAPKGQAHGRYRHGLQTREAVDERRALRALRTDAARLIAAMRGGDD